MLHNFYSRFGLAIILATIASLPLLYLGVSQAIQQKRSDVYDFFPDGYPDTDTYRWFREVFGGDQYILVSWDGCVTDDPRLTTFTDAVLATDGQATGGRFREAITVNDFTERLESLDKNVGVVQLRRIVRNLKGILLGRDGKQTCVMLMLSERGEAQHGEAVESVRDIAEQACEISRNELRLAGLPVENWAVDRETERTLLYQGCLSAIVAIIIAWYFLRSWRLSAWVFFVSACSAMLSIAMIWFSGGTLDAIQMTMPAIVYVLTLSGAIHLVNYYRDAQAEGIAPREAAAAAVKSGWLPIALAAVTTALGLLSLLSSDLRTVRNFGVYTAAGVVGALIFLLGFLPAALYRWPVASVGSSRSDHSWIVRIRDRLAGLVVRRHAMICGMLLVCLALSSGGLLRIDPEYQVLRLFDEDSDIIRDYNWFEEKIGPMMPLEIVVDFDREYCRQTNLAHRFEVIARMHLAIQKLDEVGKVTSLWTFLPAPPSRTGVRNYVNREIFSDKVAQLMKDGFVDLPYMAYDDDESREHWRITVRLWTRSDVDYREFVEQVRQQVEPIVRRYHPVEGVAIRYTGIVPLISAAQEALLHGLTRSIILAFLLIAVVMMVVLRSFVAGLMSMIPNVFPVILVFGCMGWLNVPLDVGSMITATVAMGVAVDDTLHMLIWYQRGLDQGLDRREATLSAYRRCGLALFHTTAIAGLGLLVFVFSNYTSARQFGVLMFLLLSAALVGDLLLLPALLVGPVGRWFRARQAIAGPDRTGLGAGGR